MSEGGGRGSPAVDGRPYSGLMLETFHPAVRAWFERRFPEGPTPAQAEGWREIAAGRHTLIAAPTGSGKTLAGFLVCIDRMYRATRLGWTPWTDRRSSMSRR